MQADNTFWADVPHAPFHAMICLPPVDKHTPVNILPFPKLLLWVVKTFAIK